MGRGAIQDGEAPEGVGLRTIQEGHTRRRGTRRGRAQDHTGGPYKTERDQRGSGPGPYRRAIQDGEGPEGVGPRTIQESHTRRRRTRGGRAHDHTGEPYKTERNQKGV